MGHHQAGVLDCCFTERGSSAYSAGMDRCVKLFDFTANKETIVGAHDKAVRCLEFSSELGVVVSGSWDETLRAWDARSHHSCTNVVSLPGKVYTLALSGNRVIVGTAARHVWIFDLRRLDTPQQKRISNLKFQTRCIRAFPDNTGYALSSTEGRVAIEYFDASPEVQARRYAFKCHRSTHDGVQTVWPVNAVAFHPLYGTFATGGCDGFVNVWDAQNKKRLCQFHKYPTSIAALTFNVDGSALAIASSYTFEEGEKDHPPDAIIIREPSALEVSPKQK